MQTETDAEMERRRRFTEERRRSGLDGRSAAATAARERCVPPGFGDREASLLVRALVTALTLRDPETASHCFAVAELSTRTGRTLGLSRAALVDLHYAAVTHDVGKLGVPDAILAKRGPLDESEWAVVHRHSEWGEEMLFESPSLARVSQIVRASHERMDGSGYPDGLVGEEIPIEARIVAVCDTFDALTSDRPYQGPVECDAALAELRRSSGSHFDPGVVDAFCGLPELAEFSRVRQAVAA
jgi:HD-GYP domain-containing protein (c-di-GMP phosphodiesterase class II)